jgi:tetratricopeptide (TPR) repeat protein
MNHGLLAMQLGHEQEALQAWKNAVADAPTLADAHFYLAAELDRENKPADALPHYEKFLTLVASQGPENRPPAAKLIGAALKMADCQLRTNHPETALQSYELARKLAAQTGEKKLESFASMNEAALVAGAHQTGEALQLYQRALWLDNSLQDFASEVPDLYTYASFLHEAGFPARLSYAVLLRADALIQAPAKNPSGAASLRKTLEQQLGPAATALRGNYEAALAEALALKR